MLKYQEAERKITALQAPSHYNRKERNKLFVT